MCLSWPLIANNSLTVAPPQQSPEEIRAMEAEATFTLQQVAATAVFLYLCTPSAIISTLSIPACHWLTARQLPSPLTSSRRSSKYP